MASAFLCPSTPGSHTYTTRAVKEGLAPEMLQKILWYADYSTTANIYTHIDAETLVDAVTNALLTNAESDKKEKLRSWFELFSGKFRD